MSRVQASTEKSRENSWKRVRACPIGAGQMANRVHYPSLASFADVEMSAVCDIDESGSVIRRSGGGSARPLRTIAEMVQSVQPDAVYAIGQPHLMYDIWVWCLSQGCNLYIEKADGAYAPPGRAMLAHLVGRARRVTQVSHQRRSSPFSSSHTGSAQGGDRLPMRCASSTSAPPRPCSARETT